MTKAQNSKLQMYEVLLQHLKTEPDALAFLPAFSKAASALGAIVTGIHATVDEQTTITTGVKQSKNARKKTLARLATSVADSLCSYAFDKGDSELEAKTNVSPAELEHLPDAELGSRAQKIYEWAAEIAEAVKTGDVLAPYGITAEVLAALKAALDAYNDKSKTPRVAITSKAALTRRLQELFTEADAQIEKHLDKLVGKLKEKWPDYHTGYETASVVANPATISRKPSADKNKKDSGKEEGGKAA